MLTSFFKYFFLFLPCGKVYASYFLKELVCQLSTEYVFHRDLPVFFFIVVVKVIGFCSCCVVTVEEGSFLFCFVFLFRWGFFVEV